MKIGNPRLILDPYEWLPSDGESKVEFRSVGLDSILDIGYEKESDQDGDEVTSRYKRSIIFKKARYFVRLPFPGVSFFEYEPSAQTSPVGGLTEYLDSEFAINTMQAMQAMNGSHVKTMRHFSIQFLSANIGFHVLAEDFMLTEESASP